MSTGTTQQGALATTFREQMDANRPVQAQGAALPGHLARLASNVLAGNAHADHRDTPDLVSAAAGGDRAAELPLYVRAAADLERTAARATGDSALGREDLHQEAAIRLIQDSRSGMISEKFGGKVGPYIGRAIRRHLVDLVDSQRPGRPPIPGRERRRLREALNATMTTAYTYDTVAAVQYARAQFGWTLRHFWTVHGSVFGTPVQWGDAATGGGLTFAETTADPAAADEFDRAEHRVTVRRLIDRADLTARENDIINAVYGFTGTAATTEEAAALLGMSSRHVKRLRASALTKLMHAASDIGLAGAEAPTADIAPIICQQRRHVSVPCLT
ncbi:RNA polymerase sigma factor (sigma-70 family) [Amycolatopsis sulphurea]|uniref:RNA polymerase sigma factor (Sigma-70 family) n=1 Tax=Amycolatopsis sulphurea TaxID=76022 RepID=A0A2A9F9Q9_9PSEU|nr:sigma factor-like helix-turn-helix DNA-binding protein [Amycolatopsis sulphurea]PFG48094.1 RNA polymerase sigma factor (sigma-70 family) [Amycolatopsis sulphurea]